MVETSPGLVPDGAAQRELLERILDGVRAGRGVSAPAVATQPGSALLITFSLTGPATEVVAEQRARLLLGAVLGFAGLDAQLERLSLAAGSG